MVNTIVVNVENILIYAQVCITIWRYTETLFTAVNMKAVTTKGGVNQSIKNMLNIITYLWKLLNVICATRCFRHHHTGTIIKTANIDTPNFSNLISLVIDSVQTVYYLYSWQALICDNQNKTC